MVAALFVLAAFVAAGCVQAEEAPEWTQYVDDVKDAIAAKPASDFDNPNQQKALVNKLEAVERMIEVGNYRGAALKMIRDVVPHIKDWLNTDIQTFLMQEDIPIIIEDIGRAEDIPIIPD